MSNGIRTTLLLAVMTALILWVGQMIGGRQGMTIALLFAGGMNFFSYWYSDKMVLRMYRAQPVTQQQAPDIYRVVQDLANKAELPMPKIYIIPQQAPNAFATGRDPEHAVVAVTDGLVRMLDHREIAGVLAHEMAHVKNRDILIGSIAATLAGAIMMMASMARWSAFLGGGQRDGGGGGRLGVIGLIALSVLAPMAAVVVQMTISRSREYLADSTGARIAGEAEGLARALEKLGAYSGRRPLDANPATAHMFIVNPLSGKSLMNLFSTHPALGDRISRLRGVRPVTSGPDDRSGGGQSAGRAFWERLSK